MASDATLSIRVGVSDTDALYRASEGEVKAAYRHRNQLAWREVCRVLEGDGYGVSDREAWYGW